MTSKTGKQIIKMHILPNISRSKVKIILRKIFFFKIHAKNEARRLVPDLCLFFFKTLIYGKSKWSAP